jgi:hypothetical protein
MSHFTRVKTFFTNVELISQAMESMAFRRKAISEVRGWQGATCTRAQIAFATPGPYDVGFIKESDGTYSLTGDWWGLRVTTGLEREKLVTQLQAFYHRLESEISVQNIARQYVTTDKQEEQKAYLYSVVH